MKPLMISFRIFSSILVFYSLLLVGCSGVQKPDTVLYGVNAPAMKLRGYNLRDYDDDGNRRPGAKLYEIKVAGIGDLNGWTCTDPQGFSNLKVYVGDLRDELKEKCK